MSPLSMFLNACRKNYDWFVVLNCNGIRAVADVASTTTIVMVLVCVYIHICIRTYITSVCMPVGMIIVLFIALRWSLCVVCVPSALLLFERKSDDTKNLAIQSAKKISIYICVFIYFVLVEQNKANEMVNRNVEWVAAKKLLIH